MSETLPMPAETAPNLGDGARASMSSGARLAVDSRRPE
jgi:hypothetical protein